MNTRYSLTVSKDGNGSYMTIQEALDAVPYMVPATITVKEGIYREKLFSDKHDLVIRGEGKVLITFSDGARELLADGRKRGTFRSYTAFFSGEKLHLENLTIQNTAGRGCDAGQAVALYLDVSESHLVNVNLMGHQDTLFLAPLPDEEREERGFYGPRCFLPRKRTYTLFEGGSISGGVDFIFGGGDAIFRNAEIISVEKGFVTAPSGKKDWDGLTFEDCTFTSPLDVDGEIYLMRPWRDEGKARFVRCTFGRHISKDGFIAWPGRADKAHLSSFSMEECTFSAL